MPLGTNLYRTIQEDTFDAAAYRIWGRESMARGLIDANPGYTDVVFFPAGVELTVPDVEAPVSAEVLPGWVSND